MGNAVKRPRIKDAIHIIEKLREAGYIAYLVGGHVRDKVRGAATDDYDIATDATPREVRKIFPRTLGVGVSFGVVLVIMDGAPYEVATFRSDMGYSDGRHPDDVRFTTPEEDAERRDFTVNAMFYDPVEDRVIDYVGGQKDIERRIIRTVGNPEDRFGEDKLRMLRAVRFAGKLGYEIEPETAAAIVRHAREILEVSSERIREELTKILTGPSPRKGIELAGELGLLEHILPEVECMKGVGQPPEFHPEGDVFEHTMLALEKMPKNPEIELAMGVLLHDVGKPPTYKMEDRIRFNGHAPVGASMAEKIVRRLRFSKRQQDLIVELVRQHLKFMNVREMRTAKLKRFLRTDRFDLHLELHRIDCESSHGNLDNLEFCKKKLDEFDGEDNTLRPPPLITGKDLIEMGMEPGPVFKTILTRVEDAQLDGSIKTREEALDFVREMDLKGQN